MIEQLEALDRSIVLGINSLHSPFLDECMWLISSRLFWLPLYLFMFFLAYRQFGLKKASIFVAYTGLCIILADLISVYALKEVVQRYRPSHHALLIDKLHFYQIGPNDYYTGGQYGFVSSHATNFFALFTTFFLIFKTHYPKLVWLFFGVGLLICFSRIYLGVHYLSDIVGGMILGILVSVLVHRFVWKRINF